MIDIEHIIRADARSQSEGRIALLNAVHGEILDWWASERDAALKAKMSEAVETILVLREAIEERHSGANAPSLKRRRRPQGRTPPPTRGGRFGGVALAIRAYARGSPMTREGEV